MRKMEQTLSKEEKLKILKPLEEDKEFRYAVAGLIGVSEILERLDRIEENLERLWTEVRSLREGQEKLWENQEKLWIEVRSLREGQGAMLKTLNRLAASFDRLTISVEEEARDVVRQRLKEELGVDVALDRLFIDEREINLYGAKDDLCVVGEVSIRLGVRLLDELEEKIDFLKLRKPELLRAKLVKVVYADYAVPAALESAKKRGIWVLKWSGDLTQRVIHEMKT